MWYHQWHRTADGTLRMDCHPKHSVARYATVLSGTSWYLFVQCLASHSPFYVFFFFFSSSLSPFFFCKGLIMMKHQIWNPFGVQDINLSFEMIRTRLTNECRAMFEAGVSPPYVAGTHMNAARLPPQLIVRQLHPGMMMDEQGTVPSSSGAESSITLLSLPSMSPPFRR